VIVSQASGADWLYLNKDGMLATDLKASGKDGRTLTSVPLCSTTSGSRGLDLGWHESSLA